MSEDCLFLNVYTPREPGQPGTDRAADSLLPVLVFIHGGGFIIGASDIYEVYLNAGVSLPHSVQRVGYLLNIPMTLF
jgi:carboxylesterase type B